MQLGYELIKVNHTSCNRSDSSVDKASQMFIASINKSVAACKYIQDHGQWKRDYRLSIGYKTKSDIIH